LSFFQNHVRNITLRECRYPVGKITEKAVCRSVLQRQQY